jgi:hypothetical protein
MLVKMDDEGKLATVIILIAGRAGVGKTTVAEVMEDYLEENHFSANVDHFAEAIKLCAYSYFGWDGEKDDKGRVLLQKLGLIGREYNQNVWADHLVYRYFRYPTEFLIVDDWRFPNEKSCLQEVPGVKVVTVRINAPQHESLLGTPVYNDVSEVSLSNDFSSYDYTIQNNDTLGALQLFARMIIDDLRGIYGTMLVKGEE